MNLIKFRYEFTYEFMHKFVQEFIHKIKTEEKSVCEISEIRAQISSKEGYLCTNLNKPTGLHQDRHSKASSFDNYMINLKVNLSRLLIKVFNLHCCVC